MRTLIKRMLVISNRQDYFGKVIWINLAICIITMFFSAMNDEFFIRAQAHLLIEMAVSITTCGMFAIHRRNHTDYVHFISSHSKWTKFCVLLLSSVIQNSMFLLFFLMELTLIFKAPIGVAIVTAVLHFTYAIAFGALAGTVITNYTADILCLVGYYMIFTDTRWPEMEPLRLFSPVLQLVNLGSIDISNTVALIGLSIIVLTICYIIIPISIKKMNWKSDMVFLLGLLIILSVGFHEYQYNINIKNSKYVTMEVNHIKVAYRGVDRQEAKSYGEWLSYIETELVKEKMIKKPIRKLTIQKYFISHPWLPYLNNPMIPVQVKDEVMQINIFSKAMMLHTNAEFRYDMLDRMLEHYLATTEKGKNLGPYVLDYVDEIIMNANNSFPDYIKQYIH